MYVDQFTSEHGPTETDAPFELENSYTLDIAVNGSVLAKAGSMIAYTGDLSFTGKSSAEGGLTGFIKEAATSEGTPVMRIEGDGHAYLADNEKNLFWALSLLRSVSSRRSKDMDAGDAVKTGSEIGPQ